MGNHTVDGATPGGNVTGDPGAAGAGGDPAVWERVLDWVVGVGSDLAGFAAILVAGYVVGRILQWLYDRFRQGRQITSRQILVGKTMVLGAVTVALAMGLTNVYHVDLLTLFTTLGILSVALGFGMQNTVANLAAGVGLSLDKPFDVGDRIQVGQTWGDVESIGLRSTRIITTSGQHVVIPNAVLDTQEVWNSTLGKRDHLRLELMVGISYDSSVELADHLMLTAARRNDNVVAYPEPVVRARRFGPDSVDLELRVWLQRAALRPAVRDQLLRAIKAAFDENGVHFPFPQRTVSYLKDQAPAAPTPPHLEGGAGKRPPIMVCTRGIAGARANAEAIVELVHRLDGRLVVLHVRAPHEAMVGQAAQDSINEYVSRAQRKGVPASGRTEVGDLSTTVARVAKEEGARLVLFGRTRHPSFTNRWVAREIAQAGRSCHAPVIEFDTDRHLDEDFVAEWRDVVHRQDGDDAEAARAEARRRDEQKAGADGDAAVDPGRGAAGGPDPEGGADGPAGHEAQGTKEGARPPGDA